MSCVLGIIGLCVNGWIGSSQVIRQEKQVIGMAIKTVRHVFVGPSEVLDALGKST